MPTISFDRAVDYYDNTRGFQPGVAEQVRDAILAYVHATPSTRFLELGIGTGRIALPFIEAGYVYDGIDISGAMMAKLDQKLVDLAIAQGKRREDYRCELVEADITKPLPYADSSYHVEILVHVLHLIDDWQAVLQEAKRVLTPGGWILIVGTGNRQVDQVKHNETTQVATHYSDPTAIRQIRARWDEILQTLGVDRNTYRSGGRADLPTIESFLKTLGFTTELVDLLEYTQPPVSPRVMADRIKGRMYSGEWELPDDIHAEAVKQFDQWFAESVTDPDVPLSGREVFRVLTAH